MKRILLLFTILFFAYNTNAQSVKKTEAKKEVIQVAFLKNGIIHIDGKNITEKEFELKLKNLKQKKGIIHFYQTPKIRQAYLKKNIDLIQLIKKYKLPMKAYTDRNFTRILNH